MESDIIIVLIILSVTVILLVLDLVRIDIVAIGCMLALGWTGVLNSQEMFSGFSSNAVIAMLSVMILGRGIARTGIMDEFSKFIISKAGSRKRNLVGLLSISAGLLSGLIQNIGAAALFLPGIMQVSRRTKIPASSLIMPIGFAAILGGTLTMVGSGPLILVNDLLRNEGLEAYNLFSVTPVGIVLLLSGIGYFLLFGNKVLPKKKGGETGKTEQEKLVEKLDLPDNITLLTVPDESSLAGKTTEEAGLWKTYNINLLGIGKGEDVVYAPWRENKFENGQTLAVLGSAENTEQFSKDFQLENLSSSGNFSDDFDPNVSGFAEVIIPPDSELARKSIREYSLRKRYAVEPVILFNKGERVGGDFSDVEIRTGDALIVYGRWDNIKDLKESADFVVVTDFDVDKKDKSKTWPAIGCFVFAITLAMFGFPISMAFLTGALCMVLARVLNIGQAYDSIEWKVVFLLAGLIPLGVAMQKTGTATFLAESIMSVVIDLHPVFFILMIGVLSTVFSLFMSNVGAIVVLTPLVIGMASIAGIDPRPLVLMAAVCAANSFILPTHQVNAFLMSSGGYRNADYLKAGSGMTILFLAVTVTLFYFFII
ncbi:MAG: SLC13 family permease [Salegentibacter sp.]|uniref:Di-and tricarboxylate transporter n=1 Tax=Salegentibacter flavus TaxID=287099 RepID=A0A1I4ZDP2_9FLAO|nr:MULTISPECIES: SLC13 family permease [Salegentibacter]MDR9456830.1 SLC13 family permease [Salegentibacter sp.]SFN48143.1 Di-and tricarboxylate transporter [Salegentibacter flavus]